MSSRYVAVACASDVARCHLAVAVAVAPPMHSIVLLTLILHARIAQGLIGADLVDTKLATFLFVKALKTALAVFCIDGGFFLTGRIIQAVTLTFAGRTILALVHSLPVTVRMIITATLNLLSAKRVGGLQ